MKKSPKAKHHQNSAPKQSVVRNAIMRSSISRSHSMVATAGSMLNNTEQTMVIATKVIIRGRRLRQILNVLPIDNIEVQMLAREFYKRCDLQEKYMSLQKCAESFGISSRIIRGVYSYIRRADCLDDIPYNYARKMALLCPPSGGRSSVIDDLTEWSKIYNIDTEEKENLHTPRKSMLTLPRLFLTFENFVEAAVYLSSRASKQQRFDLAFSIFDANGDGMIDCMEIRAIMFDSLERNLAASDSKNVHKIFKKEVEELVSDLKSQYNSDSFSKKEFIEFSRGVEFLNCFTVNKHWLRDILGGNKDNLRHARPQEAELRTFLDSICEGEENPNLINDLQEKLRDHLVDTIDDLKTFKRKHFDSMKIDRRVSSAIFSKMKMLNKLQHIDENYQTEMISGPLLDGQYDSDDGDEKDSLLDKEIVWDKCTKFWEFIASNAPSTHTQNQSIFVIVHFLQILISGVSAKWTAISSHGLYLSLFLAPFCFFYPFLTKYFDITTNSKTAHFILYSASSESQKINIFFAILYLFLHIFGASVQKNELSLPLVSGFIAFAFGSVGILFWFLSIYREKFDPFHKINRLLSMCARLVFLISFIAHCTISIHKNQKGQNYADLNILLFVSLTPTILIIILYVFEFIFLSKRMRVVCAKNERPNYLLLSLQCDKSSETPKWKCGQYVELSCPAISQFERHPFFISSSPDNKRLKLSILSHGNWTQKLWELYISHQSLSENNLNEPKPDLRINGPYGVGFTSSKMHYNFDYLLVVATTKSTEIIASLLHFVCNNFLQNPSHPIRKIYVYWMVSSNDGCYWFYKLLRDLKNIHIDTFIPCIFVTSSKDENCRNAFGLNFFLALRRDSLQTNLLTQQIENHSSHGRNVSTFQRMDNQKNPNEHSPVSRSHHLNVPHAVFRPPGRQSRFFGASQQKISLIIGDQKHHKLDFADNNMEHGIEINNNMEDEQREEIPMTSPDFRHAFSKIREELLRSNKSVSNCWNPNPIKSKRNSNLNRMHSEKMHGIVPALIVAANNGDHQRSCHQVGTFFVGSEILEHRLKHICQQFTDGQVVFEFNSIVVGDKYEKRYST